jgi:protease-4
MEEIKSAPLKAEPSPFHPASAEAKAMIDSMIVDSYGWFVDLVAQRRGLSAADARKLGDGSVFTGRQAARNHLIDIVGGESEIRSYLAGKDVDKNLDIVDWEERKSGAEFFFGESATDMLTALRGGSLLLTKELKDLADRKLFLDGLVSVWQVGNTEE